MYKAEIVFKTPKDKNYFFGYYDKLQLNADNNKLLALEVDFIKRMPNADDIAGIGYFDLSDSAKRFIKLTETKAFNWQQGCMLQWVGPDCNNKVIYNDFIDKKFVAILFDVETGAKTILEKAIYTMHPAGNMALCIDFERHYWCRRGYSYEGIYNKGKNKKVVGDDGIWLLDIEQNSVRKIIALEKLIKIRPLSNMKNATHYLEHLMFNQSGLRFCFLHRWKMEDGGVYTRLYTANYDGTDIYLLNDSGRVSHFGWRNDRELLAYGALENKINALRRHKWIVKRFIRPLLPLYHRIIKDNSRISKTITGDSYLVFMDKTEIKQRVASSISSEDGHPSFSRTKEDIFITDTYPDPREGSLAKLILYDLKDGKEYILNELSSLADYDDTPLRCDLHPRWSLDGRYISVDTMNDGTRGVYLYELNRV